MTDQAVRWRAATRAGWPARRRLQDGAIAAALVLVFPLAILIVRAAGDTPLCAFRLLVGRPCPLCGMTHAFALAAGGHWEEAFASNPLWPLAAAAVLGAAVLFAGDAVRGGHAGRDLLEDPVRRWWIPALMLPLLEALRLIL